MVMIEMRNAAYDTAFELLEEAKHSAKKTKLTLCELEDAMYECLETSKEDDDEDYASDDTDIEYRRRYGSRGGYRHEANPDMYEDEDSTTRYGMRRMNRRSGMRRNRMGRFV